ncbi:hypothetical protein QM012_000388 [Aureobasidium pullulans]|uniref:Uncharacterized protein n=1 Tax=Aureobasidium pullulans TaxID=5580 RepID=A0ABR0TX13_AURPU
MFERPATLAAVIPCAVLVYLSLTPAGHYMARKQLKNWESQGQDGEPEAMKGHKIAKLHGHEHTKKHGSEAHREEHVGKAEGDKESKGR